MKWKLVDFALLLVIVTLVYSQNEFLSERIAHGVRQMLKYEKKSLKLLEDVTELKSLKCPEIKNREVCQTCILTINEVIKLRKNGMDRGNMGKHLQRLCQIFSSWHNITCAGEIELGLDAVLYMIDNKADLTAERVCSIYFQEYGCIDPNRIDWDVVIPEKVNATKQVEFFMDNKILKVLHLTDIHYDPHYKTGSKINCDYDLCCQKTCGSSPCRSNAAGYWGSYGVCDIPWHTIENGLQHIKQNHTNIDFVYYTGDIISHRSWDTTVKSNSDAIKKIYKKFCNTFGKIPVYPILGNHEPHPTDFWHLTSSNASTSLSTQWLFDLVADLWSAWLPDIALKTVQKGGYYTVLVKPGLRIIALNSNVCYKANLWLFYDDKDPFGQLQWLVDTLKQAEDSEEQVHILSHVPPGHTNCLRNWNDVFTRIVRRFSKTIKAQFNGHTHYDEFRIFYDDNNLTKPINVAYNGGSFTTFVDFNPNYRIYDIDFATNEVMDYDQWFLNITDANMNGKKGAKWQHLYKFKNAYKMKSMILEDLQDLTVRMKEDGNILRDYYKNQVRYSDVLLKKGCDTACLNAKLCAIKNVDFKGAVACNDN